MNVSFTKTYTLDGELTDVDFTAHITGGDVKSGGYKRDDREIALIVIESPICGQGRELVQSDIENGELDGLAWAAFERKN